MELNIESIKALDRDKVYVIEVDPAIEMDYADIVDVFQNLGVDVVVIPRGLLKFITVPEGVNGIQIIQK